MLKIEEDDVQKVFSIIAENILLRDSLILLLDHFFDKIDEKKYKERDFKDKKVIETINEFLNSDFLTGNSKDIILSILTSRMN